MRTHRKPLPSRLERQVNRDSHRDYLYWSRDSGVETAAETYAGVGKPESVIAGGIVRTGLNVKNLGWGWG